MSDRCPHVVQAVDWSQLWIGRRSIHAAANVSYYEVRRKMRGYSMWIPACKITQEKLARIEALLGGKPSVFLRALADLAEEVGE